MGERREGEERVGGCKGSRKGEDGSLKLKDHRLKMRSYIFFQIKYKKKTNSGCLDVSGYYCQVSVFVFFVFFWKKDAMVFMRFKEKDKKYLAFLNSPNVS